MNRTLITVAAISLAAGLAACGQKAEERSTDAAPVAAEGPAASNSASMDAMNMGTAQPDKTAKGTGTVTAVDPAAGTVTIDHAPIPEAGWPAMTMGFKASPAVVQSVSVGDKVAFDLNLVSGGGEITAIQKQ